MYTRKTTMTRWINRLIESTVSLISARRAPPMGPMQTMLTSAPGQAGIRPLPALAPKPQADPEERRGAMRISKQFKLSLMAALVGLAILSDVVAEEAPARQGVLVAQTVRNSFGTPPDTEVELQRAANGAKILIESQCRYPDEPIKTKQCVGSAFYHLCPKGEGGRWDIKRCEKLSNLLLDLNYLTKPLYGCATKENGDQLCLFSPIPVSSGDLLPISIDIGDLNCGTIDNVDVTVQVSTAGAELSRPYRDPGNPGDFDLTWTGSPYDWVGTALLGSISGAVSAQPVFAIGNVPANDSVTITANVDYTCDGQSDFVDVSSTVELLSETAVTAE